MRGKYFGMDWDDAISSTADCTVSLRRFVSQTRTTRKLWYRLCSGPHVSLLSWFARNAVNCDTWSHVSLIRFLAFFPFFMFLIILFISVSRSLSLSIYLSFFRSFFLIFLSCHAFFFLPKSPILFCSALSSLSYFILSSAFFFSPILSYPVFFPLFSCSVLPSLSSRFSSFSLLCSPIPKPCPGNHSKLARHPHHIHILSQPLTFKTAKLATHSAAL